MKRYALLAFFFASATAVHAGQSFDASAVATGTQKTQYYQISEGHVVAQILSEYENIEATDSANPLNGNSGSCFGALEIIAGMPTGGGNCVFTDDDGNMITSRWTAAGFGADGALVGSWVNTGGSGKYAGISGGGAFSTLTDQATGTFRNEITGAMVLP